MKRQRGIRARLGGALVASALVVAMLALPGVASTKNRGHDHPAPAGTIESFDSETGALTIDLTEGGSISGLVVRRTHIRCGHGLRHQRRRGLRHRKRGSQASASERGGPEGARDGPTDRGEQQEDPPGHDGTPPGHSEGPGMGAENSARCTTEDLTEGATVKFAELVLLDGNAYYKVVGLSRQEPAEEG